MGEGRCSRPSARQVAVPVVRATCQPALVALTKPPTPPARGDAQVRSGHERCQRPSPARQAARAPCAAARHPSHSLFAVESAEDGGDGGERGGRRKRKRCPADGSATFEARARAQAKQNALDSHSFRTRYTAPGGRASLSLNPPLPFCSPHGVRSNTSSFQRAKAGEERRTAFSMVRSIWRRRAEGRGAAAGGEGKRGREEERQSQRPVDGVQTQGNDDVLAVHN